MQFGRVRVIVLTAVAFLIPAASRASLLPVINPSFESPTTDFAWPFVDGWTTFGPEFDEVYQAYLNTGVFLNQPAGDPERPGHIAGAEGLQLAFIGTETLNEFRQVLGGEAFEAGQLYTLSVGLATSLFSPPAETDKLVMELYYLDAAGGPHPVASLDVFNDVAAGLSDSQLKRFEFTTGPVGENDPWNGRPIGIRFSTIGAPGGFFDMDDVRLSAVPEPASAGLLSLAGLLLMRRRMRA